LKFQPAYAPRILEATAHVVGHQFFLALGELLEMQWRQQQAVVPQDCIGRNGYFVSTCRSHAAASPLLCTAHGGYILSGLAAAMHGRWRSFRSGVFIMLGCGPAIARPGNPAAVVPALDTG